MTTRRGTEDQPHPGQIPGEPLLNVIVPIPLLGLLAACSPSAEVQAPTQSAPSPPTLEVDLAAPWSIAHRDEEALTLKLGEGPDGARIQLIVGEDGRMPGVSPIHDGQTLEVGDGANRWPLMGVAYPERPLSRVQLLVEGVDLVIRMYGPTFSEVLPTAEAPDDPVLTWVRVRRRPEDWMVSLLGLGQISLEPTWGEVSIETTSPRVTEKTVGARSTWSNVDSLLTYTPYPETTVRLQPVSP